MIIEGCQRLCGCAIPVGQQKNSIRKARKALRVFLAKHIHIFWETFKHFTTFGRQTKPCLDKRDTLGSCIPV